MKKITLLTLFFCAFSSLAQVTGIVTDSKNNPLPYVSVYLENSLTGTTTNNNGSYVLNIEKNGKDTIIFQFLGYKTLKKKVKILKLPFTLNVVLEDEKVVLDEIYVSSKENPANNIIRSVIQNKDKNIEKIANFKADFYSRGIFKIKNAPKKVLGLKVSDMGGGLDSTRSGVVYLSETVSKITSQRKPKNFKERIIASKVSGEDNGISFNEAAQVNFDYYKNEVPIADVTIFSPISDYAFSYYSYKLEGSFYDHKGNLINKIKVTPKRKNDRVFEGFIYIVEDSWAVYGVDFSISGKQFGLPVIDVLHLKQNFNFHPTTKSWVLILQTIDFKFGIFGFKMNGRFSASYSNYKFASNFDKNTFSNEVLSFEKNASKKDSVYWNRLRSVPLTLEEKNDYKLKDSIKIVRNSKKYLDSVDVENNKFSWGNLLFGYSYRNTYKKKGFSISSPILNTGFNTVQGMYSSVGFNYFKRKNDLGNWMNIGTNFNYGFSEKIVRPTFYFQKNWNNFSRPRLTIEAGVLTPQFNHRGPISKLDNSIYSLFDRKNHLKIYEKTFARISYSQEVKNGVFLTSSIEHSDRKPLFNTSNYSFFKRDTQYTSNNPLQEQNNFSAPFRDHTIWTAKIGFNIVFGQKYVSYPDFKSNLGNDNKYPNLYIGYRGSFGADDEGLNSDLFLVNIDQKVPLGKYGNFDYNLRSGLFLRKKNIAFMDYLHTNGNQLPYRVGNSLTSFGLLDYYKLSTNDKYAEFHVEHNFKGFILRKIPGLNSFGFHLVASAKTLLTADRKPYSEFSIGLDNVGFGKWRFLRIDYVQSSYRGITNNGILLGITIDN